MNSADLLSLVANHIGLTRSFAITREVHVMATRKPGVFTLNGDWDDVPEGALEEMLLLAQARGAL